MVTTTELNGNGHANGNGYAKVNGNGHVHVNGNGHSHDSAFTFRPHPQETYAATAVEPSSFYGKLRHLYANQVLKTQLEQMKKQGSYDAFKLKWHPVYEVRRLTGAHTRPDGIPPSLFWESDVGKWIEGACYFLSSSEAKSCIYADAQVCSHWRNISLRSSSLWTTITKDTPAAWISIFLDRSASQPLFVYFLVRKYLEQDRFARFSCEMHRVRELTMDLEHLGAETDYFPSGLEVFLSKPAPILETFIAIDHSSDWDWELPRKMFNDQASRLHSVKLAGFMKTHLDTTLVKHVRHLDGGWQHTAFFIAPMLVNAPFLETLKYTMGPDPDFGPEVEEVLGGLRDKGVQFPFELPHLTRFQVDRCMTNDLLRFLDHFIIPPSARWQINFNHDWHVRSTSWLRALDLLTNHIHHRQSPEVAGPLNDLKLDLGHRMLRGGGWTDGVLSKCWCRGYRAPGLPYDLAEFDFELYYNERDFSHYAHRGPSMYTPFAETIDLFTRLPLSQVRNAWFASYELLRKNHPDIADCCNDPSMWRKILRQFPELRTMRLSRGVVYGVFRALTEANEARRPALRYLEELIVNIRNTKQYLACGLPSANPGVVMRHLYDFVKLQYDAGRPLGILRTDLCETLCSSGIAMDAFVALVNVGVYCTQCGREVLRAMMDDKKMMKIEFIVPSGKYNYERLEIHIKENYTYSSITEFVCAWYGLSSKNAYCVSIDVKEKTMPRMVVHVPNDDEEVVEGGVSNVDQD